MKNDKWQQFLFTELRREKSDCLTRGSCAKMNENVIPRWRMMNKLRNVTITSADPETKRTSFLANSRVSRRQNGGNHRWYNQPELADRKIWMWYLSVSNASICKGSSNWVELPLFRMTKSLLVQDCFFLQPYCAKRRFQQFVFNWMLGIKIPMLFIRDAPKTAAFINFLEFIEETIER